MNPPVRGGDNGERLYRALLNGTVEMIATDHSPHTEEEKAPKNVWEAISGFVGVEVAPRLDDQRVREQRQDVAEQVRRADVVEPRRTSGRCIRRRGRSRWARTLT